MLCRHADWFSHVDCGKRGPATANAESRIRSTPRDSGRSPERRRLGSKTASPRPMESARSRQGNAVDSDPAEGIRSWLALLRRAARPSTTTCVSTSRSPASSGSPRMRSGSRGKPASRLNRHPSLTAAARGGRPTCVLPMRGRRHSPSGQPEAQREAAPRGDLSRAGNRRQVRGRAAGTCIRPRRAVEPGSLGIADPRTDRMTPSAPKPPHPIAFPADRVRRETRLSSPATQRTCAACHRRQRGRTTHRRNHSVAPEAAEAGVERTPLRPLPRGARQEPVAARGPRRSSSRKRHRSEVSAAPERDPQRIDRGDRAAGGSRRAPEYAESSPDRR